LPVGHQPQLVGASFDQMAVMGDQDHGARIIVDAGDQRRAAVDVEMVGRLVEEHEMGTVEGCEPQQKPRALAARELRRRRIGLGARKSDRPCAGAHLCLRLIRHQATQVIIGALVGSKLVELMLREIADLELVGARDPAGHRRQAPADELHQRRLAVAIGAQ